MLWRYLMLTLFLVSELQAEDDNQDHRILRDVLNDNIQRKCLKNGDNDTLAELEKGTEEYEECMSIEKYPSTEEELVYRFCSMYPNCLRSYLEKVMPCKHKEEEYIPDLILTSFAQLCGDDGDAFRAKIKGIFNATATCDTPMPFVLYSITTVCYPKLIFMHHKGEPDFIIYQSDTCSDLKTLQDCIIDLMPKVCGNDDFTPYAAVFLEPALEWCNNNKAK